MLLSVQIPPNLESVEGKKRKSEFIFGFCQDPEVTERKMFKNKPGERQKKTRYLKI